MTSLKLRSKPRMFRFQQQTEAVSFFWMYTQQHHTQSNVVKQPGCLALASPSFSYLFSGAKAKQLQTATEMVQITRAWQTVPRADCRRQMSSTAVQATDRPNRASKRESKDCGRKCSASLASSPTSSRITADEFHPTILTPST